MYCDFADVLMLVSMCFFLIDNRVLAFSCFVLSNHLLLFLTELLIKLFA